VLYLKAELKYITVRTAGHSYLLEASLSELEARYSSRFVRIHRNALVARRAVRSLERHFDAQEGEGWAVRLDGIDEALFVSRRQLAAVKALLAGDVGHMAETPFLAGVAQPCRNAVDGDVNAALDALVSIARAVATHQLDLQVM
jgi:hypothetical protein